MLEGALARVHHSHFGICLITGLDGFKVTHGATGLEDGGDTLTNTNVSAILVNIPGAPANIATVMDGHPMANQGRATEALHYCFISSFVGGVLGALVGQAIGARVGDPLRIGDYSLIWASIMAWAPG